MVCLLRAADSPTIGEASIRVEVWEVMHCLMVAYLQRMITITKVAERTKLVSALILLSVWMVVSMLSSVLVKLNVHVCDEVEQLVGASPWHIIDEQVFEVFSVKAKLFQSLICDFIEPILVS